ncbi:FkbM family methyltransferase [Pseudoalteromonas luteoviolacea]|uniref:FkbM family methyltransferase n=1 Tax=Pseudoalteromonas luteoviolacea TaxID=43657 RepID=UPI001EEEEF6A|nr:FkbM family methyltransferase [Pseudoalteromonas luteoviolacea]MCF6440352.1 FkbM family methyltransferase [Pseudoalteromonas luteoviolacea]
MDNTSYLEKLIKVIEGKDVEQLRDSQRCKHIDLNTLINQPITIVGAADEGVRLLTIFNSLQASDVRIVDMNEEKVGTEVLADKYIKQFCAENIVNRHVILATHRTYRVYIKCKELKAASVSTFMHLQALYPESFEPHFFHKDMLETLVDNISSLKTLKSNLADDVSVGVLASCLDYRLNGDPTVMGDFIDWDLYLPTNIDLSPFAHSYVDCGSFDGDSVAIHLSRYKNTVKQVYAFEPDPNTFDRLKDNMSAYQQVQCINKGVGDKVTKLNFSANNERASLFSESGELSIDITSLDAELENAAPSFIKMNIEAFEPQAIEGARGIINKNTPLLAISAYHQPEHLYSLQFQIESVAPNKYDFYLRQHDGGLVETVLYAVPKSSQGHI